MRSTARLQNVSADAVMIRNTDFHREDEIFNPVYSGVKFDTDGNQYARQTNGGWSSIGSWLIKGTASDYWVQTSLNSGALITDAGDDVQITTDRIYDVIDTHPGTSAKSASVTFELSSDAGGATVVAGPTTLSFNANYNTF